MGWYIAFNTAASFVTNTNWQFFAGESTLSYLSQMAGLTVQNFASAAVGIAVHGGRRPRLRAARHRRARQLLGRPGAGDALRARCRSPSSSASRSARRASSRPSTTRSPTRPSRRGPSAPPATTGSRSTQTIYRGPVASQVAIKHAGTNGGGYYNSNSAVPFENPTPLTNYLELLLPGRRSRSR